MKPNSTYTFIRLALALCLFLSCNLIMAQECTIDFSNFTIDTPDGPISVGENTTVCINQTVTLPNLNFQAGNNQPSPGIIWAVYDCQPTTVNPDDDACKRPVVLRDPSGAVIIGGGEADFSFANLPTPGESEITVCLVPIIDGDTSGLAIEDDCTGIAVGLEYPCITFLVPEDNPTQCDSDCDAFESNDECIDAVPLTLQGGTVVFPTEADSVYSNVCATREGDLEVPNCFLDGNTANTVWFSFEGTGGEYTISTNACDAANVVISDSQMAIYTGGCDGLIEVACNDDIDGSNFLSSITEFPTIEGTTYFIMVDGLDNGSGEFCMEVIETSPPCNASFGTVNFEGETATCEGGSFNFTLTGSSTDGFTSAFVITDGMGVIVNIVSPGDIDLAPGTYTVYAINFDENNADAVNAATTIEELNALNICADLQETGTEITVFFDGTPDCCEAAIGSLSVENEMVVCQVAGESLDFTINGANTGAGFSNVWYFQQNGTTTLGGVFPADVNPLTFNPTLAGIEVGIVAIYVVNVSEDDEQAVIDAVGGDMEAFVESDDICADLVDSPLLITVLAANDPDCIACEPNAGNSSASSETICDGECITLSVQGNNQDVNFQTLFLITTGDDDAVFNLVSAGETCLDENTYTIYTINFIAGLENELVTQIENGASLNDLQALIDNGDFCGMIEAEGTVITFLPPNDDACYVCDAAVGTVVNPAEDLTICFGEPLTFQVEDDNTGEGFNTQFIGAAPGILTIPIFIEDNVSQILPVGTFEFYAINYAEDEENTIINVVSMGGNLTDLLDLIDNNEFCAEISVTPIIVTVLPEDSPSCTGEPFVAIITDTTISDDGLTYTVTITMSGGSGDYTVDGTGVDGTIFISGPIPCGEPFAFEASDGAFVELLDGIAPCAEPCVANPGVMPQLDTVNPICDGGEASFNTTGSNLGDGDVLIYVLHDNAGAELGTVLASNDVSGTFNADSSTEILTNITYYISAIAGPDDNGDGVPDANNECTLVAAGTPVVFLEPITFAIEVSCDETTGEGIVAGQVFGGYPAFAADANYTFQNGTFNGTLQGEGAAFNFMLNDGDTYVLNVTDGFCTANVTETEPFECTKTPIELLSFEGEVQTEGNLLQWVTATEIENDYFTLERSTDGQTFEGITDIKSQGNSETLQSYEFLDRTAPNGLSYYRLRQTDFNGLTTVSYVVSLQRGERVFEIIQVYPNPAKIKLNITFASKQEESVEVSIYNIQGQQLMSRMSESKEGINSLVVDVSTYAAGVYFVNISNGSSIQTQRFMKK